MLAQEPSLDSTQIARSARRPAHRLRLGRSNNSVWNATTGETEAGPFTGHTHSVWSVAFSPDGQRIVSYTHDRTIRMLNTVTVARPLGPFPFVSVSVRVKSILKSFNCDANGLKRSTRRPSTFLSQSPLHRSCPHPRPIDFTSSPLKPVLLLDISSSRSLPRAQARPLFLYIVNIFGAVVRPCASVHRHPYFYRYSCFRLAFTSCFHPSTLSPPSTFRLPFCHFYTSPSQFYDLESFRFVSP
ncbi:hypothetical protein EDB89DRAFT_628739 [Lactarius sanguifluus]|nr:hypothetical protein EDB89DRAFT_628739 [Lactarius sanguifluus]